MVSQVSDRTLVVGAIVAAIAGGGALLWKFGLPTMQSGKKTSEAKELVSRELRDPSAAQFRDLVVKADSVCGEVNGKNAFGAYVGFRHFIVNDGKVALEPETPAEPLHPGVSVGILRQWEARNDFHGAWLLRCPNPLPPLPPELEPDFQAIKP